MKMNKLLFFKNIFCWLLNFFHVCLICVLIVYSYFLGNNNIEITISNIFIMWILWSSSFLLFSCVVIIDRISLKELMRIDKNE